MLQERGNKPDPTLVAFYQVGIRVCWGLGARFVKWLNPYLF